MFEGGLKACDVRHNVSKVVVPREVQIKGELRGFLDRPRVQIARAIWYICGVGVEGRARGVTCKKAAVREVGGAVVEVQLGGIASWT